VALPRKSTRNARSRNVHVAKSIVLLVFATTVGLSIFATSLTDASSAGQSSNTSCQLPSYLTNLAESVGQSPKFAAAGGGFSYTLSYGVNASATTGIVNATLVRSGGNTDQRNATGGTGSTIMGGTPYYSPPKTELVFYSYGVASQPFCASNPYPGQKVISALWVNVPESPNGSYNFTGMTIYHTPGLFVNGTVSSR